MNCILNELLLTFEEIGLIDSLTMVSSRIDTQPEPSSSISLASHTEPLSGCTSLKSFNNLSISIRKSIYLK